MSPESTEHRRRFRARREGGGAGDDAVEHVSIVLANATTRQCRRSSKLRRRMTFASVGRLDGASS
jgi:hypothetical protein